MMPIRRDLEFHLPTDRINDWHADGPHVSHFLNALSMLFPVGERFFIDSVRHYRDRITDPELNTAVTAFIGQEAMHGREHEAYNEALFAVSPWAAKIERVLKWITAGSRRFMPPSMQLSATIAAEHLTAILAERLLSDPALLDQADPRFAALWRWHAIEETEHKAVAYDVYRQVTGRNPLRYLERVFGLISASFIFWMLSMTCYLGILKEQKLLTSVRGWRLQWRYMWGRHGYLRKAILPWFSYFRPGFHPWDEDNRHHLNKVDGLVDEIQRLQPTQASVS